MRATPWRAAPNAAAARVFTNRTTTATSTATMPFTSSSAALAKKWKYPEKIIDGNAIGKSLREEVKADTEALINSTGYVYNLSCISDEVTWTTILV